LHYFAIFCRTCQKAAARENLPWLSPQDRIEGEFIPLFCKNAPDAGQMRIFKATALQIVHRWECKFLQSLAKIRTFNR
jgi:hypothetical protein